nr:hypothetical protein [Tanacetum cinerariifolium]
GTLSRYKARLVANGSTQLKGVDVDETFSLVVKSGTIQTVFSLVASRHWSIHQLDVKNAFLHGNLSETVYMHQPPGFRDSVHPDYIIRSLHQEIAMTDLGPLNYFLGISVSRDSSGLFLSQKKYVVEILDRADMVNCNLNRTPIDTESKLGSDGELVSDPTLYRSLAGSLQYLTFTRPDTSYVVQQAGYPTTRRSGYCVFLGNNLLSWSSKRQPTLSYSSVEAEHRGVANRTKHIEIDIHFVRDLVAAGQVRVLHVPSRYQFADIFTKGLPSALSEEFRSCLSVRCPPASTTGEC